MGLIARRHHTAGFPLGCQELPWSLMVPRVGATPEGKGKIEAGASISNAGIRRHGEICWHAPRTELPAAGSCSEAALSHV